MGTTGLFSIMRDRFYWPKMFQHIRQFVSTCERCKEVKRNRHPIKMPMTLRDHAPRPLGWVSIDAVGPLPETPGPEKYKYIHVLVCHGTRYVVAWPARTLTAKEFILGLYKYFLSWASNPDIIFSDNGSCYASKFTRDFLQANGIRQVFGSPWKPTTQGLVETTNGSIVHSVKAYVKEHQENWELYLYGCVFALNVREAYSMGMSPFLLNFGRQPILATESHLKRLGDKIKTMDQQFIDIIQTQSNCRKAARESLERAQIKMKARHDEKLKPADIKAGMVVYTPNHAIPGKGVSGKFFDDNRGPYLVIDRPSRHTALLRDLKTGKELKRNTSVIHLNPIPSQYTDSFLTKYAALEEEEWLDVSLESL